MYEILAPLVLAITLEYAICQQPYLSYLAQQLSKYYSDLKKCQFVYITVCVCVVYS